MGTWPDHWPLAWQVGWANQFEFLVTLYNELTHVYRWGPDQTTGRWPGRCGGAGRPVRSPRYTRTSHGWGTRRRYLLGVRSGCHQGRRNDELRRREGEKSKRSFQRQGQIYWRHDLLLTLHSAPSCCISFGKNSI